MLDLKNRAIGKTRKLDFYRVRPVKDDQSTSYQVDLDLSNYTPTWQFTAERDWFQKLRDECLAEWFGKTVSGNKLKRREHWLFKIEVSKTQFVVGFELDGTGNYPRDKIDLGVSGSTMATLAGGRPRLSFHVSTMDFAPVFYNLADRDIVGSVEISGGDAIVLLKFRSGQDDYSIAIPTASPSEKRVERIGTPRMTIYPKAAV